MRQRNDWSVNEWLMEKQPNNDIPLAANIHCRIKIDKEEWLPLCESSLSVPEWSRSDLAVIWIGILVWISRLISWLFWPRAIGTSLLAFQIFSPSAFIPFELCPWLIKNLEWAENETQVFACDSTRANRASVGDSWGKTQYHRRKKHGKTPAI